MRDNAEVVVIGGGAMGASVAWHLRELGIDDVVLLERDSLASGSTSKAAGGIRTQFADELNVRIALRSLDEFEAMEGIDLRQHGYLFLLDDAGDVERFQAALALQHSLGVPSRELSVAEALEIVPQLDPEGLLAATFCDLDGYATPEAVVQWYARGLDVRQGCAATGIHVEGGRVVGVETGAGGSRRRSSSAARARGRPRWARWRASSIPVRGEPRWMFFTPRTAACPSGCP